MNKQIKINEKSLERFVKAMRAEEREGATIEVYLRALRKCAVWLSGRSVTKEAV